MNRNSIRRKRKLAAPGSKRIHKGEQVMVIAGNELGKLGTVLAVEGPKVSFKASIWSRNMLNDLRKIRKEAPFKLKNQFMFRIYAYVSTTNL